MPAFAPTDRDESALPFPPLAACVAADVAVVAVAVVVAKAVLPVAMEPAVAVSEEEVDVVGVV